MKIENTKQRHSVNKLRYHLNIVRCVVSSRTFISRVYVHTHTQQLNDDVNEIDRKTESS